MSEPNEFWLFGYGSLIWKPPPHFGTYLYRGADDRQLGLTTTLLQTGESPDLLKDMFAGFGKVAGTNPFHHPSAGWLTSCQKASQDHRGTPESPGRVVTLIERSFWETLNDRYTIPEQRVWGTAYRIESSKVDEVKEYLDIREINGYSIQYADFYPADTPGQPLKCLVYIGMPDNPQFAGVQEPHKLAQHILESRGPSGDNKEYLYMLQQSLEELSDESGDAHVADLARRVHDLEVQSELSPREEHEKAIEHEVTKRNVGSNQSAAKEETEKGF